MTRPPPELPQRSIRFAARPRSPRPWRQALLGGVAGLALAAAAGGVLAQSVSLGLDSGALLSGGNTGLGGTPLRELPSLPPAAPATPAAAEAPAPGQDAPVTFTAEEVEYDRERGLVTARGRVEAWQGGRFLRAEEFLYDRNTGVAILRGGVQLIEADGQVFYAEEAELADGFKDGVLQEVRARLAQNARMAGTGARRSGGTVTDLARVVYSSCNLCAENPERAPLWQMRARLATQDRDAQRISYRDATIQIGGVPVLYTPFFSHPDPQVPRASGFLFPTLGYTRFLGAYAQTPYFWAIDDNSDLLVTPLFSQYVPPNLGLEYRRRFNNGELQVQGSVGYFDGNDARRLSAGLRTESELSGHVFARGRWHLNENWRVGFDVNRASSDQYLRTYRFEVFRVLSSQVFAEGFWGTERYVRADARAYQGLRSTDITSQIPFVAPNLFHEWAPGRKIMGGHLTVDQGVLGLTRPVGAWSQRATMRAEWMREFFDGVGGISTVRARGDLRAYTAGGQEKQFQPQPAANGENVDGNFRFAVDYRYPMVRDAGAWGTQTIEPRIQLVTGPNMGRQTDIPNEDSSTVDFNDANLFSLNRFVGRDRLEGGTRVDAALRGAWHFPNGGRVEGIAGRSYRFSEDLGFAPNSGLRRRGSDWVGRVTFAPTSWLEVLARARLDGDTGAHRASDVLARIDLGTVGPVDNLFLTGGYLYAPPLASSVDQTRRRQEASIGAGGQVRTRNGGTWRLQASLRYDLDRGSPVAIVGSGGYEDECFILEGRFIRRFARDPITDAEFLGNTVFLVRVGFKTVGDYFLRAI